MNHFTIDNEGRKATGFSKINLKKPVAFNLNCKLYNVADTFVVKNENNEY